MQNKESTKKYNYIKILITFPDIKIDWLVLDKFKKLAKEKWMSVSGYIRGLIYNEVLNNWKISKEDLYNLKQKEIDLLLDPKKDN